MNKGFFFSEKTQIKIQSKTFDCHTCGLYKNCLSPKMEASGEGRKGILVIAEAPGKTEDERGEQLVGQAGKLLEKKLYRLGIDLHRDCRKINAVNCRPPKNRAPTSREIEACRSRVWKEIESTKPKLILLLGSPAIESFLGHRWKKNRGGIGKWRGWVIPDRDVHAWVVPLYHPSFILRSEGKPVIDLIFEQDLKQAIQYLDMPFPKFKDEKKQVKRLINAEEIIHELKAIYRKSKTDSNFLLAFDYEATGLKPQAKGHKIVCVSLCCDANEAIAFPMMKDTNMMKWFRRLLENPKVKKTAHNIKFEDIWTREILGININGWHWCGMQASHIQDNRPGISGLKFQVYINFGVVDYDSHIAPYLQGDKKNGNSFNRIDEVPLEDLLLYCGLDSLFEYRLARKQLVEYESNKGGTL